MPLSLLLTLLITLTLLLACSAPPTPTSPQLSQRPAAPSTAPLTPTQAAVDASPHPTTPPIVAHSATPILQITLWTPTYTPTYPPLPTPLPSPTGVLTQGIVSNPTAAAANATRLARPSELGNTAADAALVSILQRCWGISDTRLLNGNNPAHRNAFECARQPLLQVAQNYPTYPFVHRVLAWGYFYKDNNSQKAISAYRTAANLYKQQGNKTGESEARMRLALLLVGTNPVQGCNELALATNLDPTNDRALDYYSAFKCSQVAARSGEGAPVPAVPQVDLGQVRGKILFKSDREGFPSYYVMDPDGKNVRRISSALYQAAAQFESWAPDRTQVATVRSAGFTQKFGFDNDIWITDPSGGVGRPLTNPANDYDPAWSPRGLFDGRAWIAFVSNRGDLKHPDNQGEEIWIMHDDGTNPLRLTCHAPFYSKHPSWSPDAAKLVFHSDWPNYRSQIYVMDMSPFGTLADNCQLGDNIVNLSNNAFNDSEPIWVK